MVNIRLKRLFSPILGLLLLLTCSSYPPSELNKPTDNAFAGSSLSITNVISPRSVALYDKFEVKFNITGTVAENLQFPYDPEDILGLKTRQGITVDGLFLPPGQSNWAYAIVQPAFLYQPTLKDRSVNAGNSNGEWIYPTGEAYWLIRFAPRLTGTWKFRIRVQDNSNYPNWTCSPPGQTDFYRLTVSSARPGVHGFVQVSQRDPRYFEYSDGTPFTGTGVNAADKGSFHTEQQAEEEFSRYYRAGKTNFHRVWMDMETIWSRGTHGWNAWKFRNPATGGIKHADELRSTEQVYKDHDFSIKLSGSANYLVQFSDGNQILTGGFDAGKSYKVSLIAAGANASDLVVKLISKPSNFNSAQKTLAPNGAWQTTDLGGGWKMYESDFVNDQGRFFFNNRKALAVGLSSGTAYLDEVYIGEDLGGGRIGPNVIFKGKMNYHQYFDPLAASNWDDIFEHAVRDNLTLKAVISDKQDYILTKIRNDDGQFDPSINNFNLKQAAPNFHSGRGSKVRRLNEYYWRYLAARWGFSRGVHSWELLNEGDPGNPKHYDHADHLAETVSKLDHNHLATTSFWSTFPSAKFWGDWAYPHLRYADVHAYISTGWIQDASMEGDAAKLHILYSEDTRNSLLETPRNMPIVRGEVGLDTLSEQEEQAELADDLYGVWLHNFTWAGLHWGGLYELYWWSNNLHGQPTDRSKPPPVGPDRNAQNGLFEIFAPYNDFMWDVRLNAGGYVDAGVQTSDFNRVVGQKNNRGRASTKAHVWIQDTRHTWRYPDSGNLSGSVTLTGMKPNTTFRIEWWDFNTQGLLRKRTETTISDSRGVITLNLNSIPAINGLPVVDTAVKIGDYRQLSTPP